mmetsp:Transcript_8242/g.20287  ORF Transcript_8242/g.20287 Transcript_8242/m.20287 type:complete len:111 (-) Transcript_8242:11-343(-)
MSIAFDTSSTTARLAPLITFVFLAHLGCLYRFTVGFDAFLFDYYFVLEVTVGYGSSFLRQNFGNIAYHAMTSTKTTTRTSTYRKSILFHSWWVVALRFCHKISVALPTTT